MTKLLYWCVSPDKDGVAEQWDELGQAGVAGGEVFWCCYIPQISNAIKTSATSY
ncbi:MAG: hypothetical protein KME32_08985 [Mojavia pulchra JT2-VF2]|uniref:Uncharacterized protein n=1 Tax=Mojavia pulchra JT2-VF2 TaxID=287848 RepID=A0A951PVV6_9NOST|nr:hypothetical protein [Mojavia pulchra JT2-VF2]